ncbi:hypothetical protein [Actinokineospora enzanensis]|uniref:hypothetical protein n=1 Tax=Actinokineospora enzanensis TaxID=155975 RepID=UPI00036CCEEA|nr:hypothetical protein [Actinokineospora enzanensis]
MHEQELRVALRNAMDATPRPPEMNVSEMLDAAHVDRGRRRSTLAGIATAVAVVLITAGAVFAPQLHTVARQISAAAGEVFGQDDTQDGKTQTAGPHAELGEHLLNQLLSSVPHGLISPDDLEPTDNPANRGGPLRYHQASQDLPNGGWRYTAEIPVGKDGRWARLYVEVDHVADSSTLAGCQLAQTFWNVGSGGCIMTPVGDKQIAVLTVADGDQIDQVAAYRYPDGTAVFIAQAKHFAYTGLTPLGTEPFTPEQLAAQAADPKFRLR